jgi:hypothetical protein
VEEVRGRWGREVRRRVGRWGRGRGGAVEEVRRPQAPDWKADVGLREKNI